MVPPDPSLSPGDSLSFLCILFLKLGFISLPFVLKGHLCFCKDIWAGLGKAGSFGFLKYKSKSYPRSHTVVGAGRDSESSYS